MTIKPIAKFPQYSISPSGGSNEKANSEKNDLRRPRKRLSQKDGVGLSDPQASRGEERSLERLLNGQIVDTNKVLELMDKAPGVKAVKARRSFRTRKPLVRKPAKINRVY